MRDLDTLTQEFRSVLERDGVDAAVARLRDKGFAEEVHDAAYEAASAQVFDARRWHIDRAAGKREGLSYTKDTHDALVSCIRFALADQKRTDAILQMLGMARAERFAGIERRLAELERSPLRYDGPHETGKSYTRGTFVTARGSLWHCDTDTAERPGESDAWTLAVKRGQDGRNAR